MKWNELYDVELYLRNLIECLIEVSQIIRVGQLVRTFVLVQVNKVTVSQFAELVHETPLIILVNLDLIQIHVFRSIVQNNIFVMLVFNNLTTSLCQTTTHLANAILKRYL